MKLYIKMCGVGLAQNAEDEIEIYLSSFKFRKNVNHLKVASKLNYYHMIELICGLEREGEMPICGNVSPDICPCDLILYGMGYSKNAIL